MKLECASAGRTADKGRVFFFYCENLVLWFLLTRWVPGGHSSAHQANPLCCCCCQSPVLLLMSVTSGAATAADDHDDDDEDDALMTSEGMPRPL